MEVHGHGSFVTEVVRWYWYEPNTINTILKTHHRQVLGE